MTRRSKASSYLQVLKAESLTLALCNVSRLDFSTQMQGAEGGAGMGPGGGHGGGGTTVDGEAVDPMLGQQRAPHLRLAYSF